MAYQRGPSLGLDISERTEISDWTSHDMSERTDLGMDISWLDRENGAPTES